MLQRTAAYSWLVRVLGGCLLLYGLYVLVLALTCQIEVTGAHQYAGATIFEHPLGVATFLLFGGFFPGTPIVPVPIQSLTPLGLLTPGSLLWVGLVVLCASVASRRALVAYGGLQAALWMISLSVWNPILWLVDASHTHYGLNGAGPFFLVTLALSLILVALYKPVTHGLTRLASPLG